MLLKPLLSAAAQCSKRTEVMTDNFYINGALPPCGSVPINKCYTKDTRGKLGVFAVSDGFGPADDASNAAHKTLSILKKYHDKMGMVSVEGISSVVETYTEEAGTYMHSLGNNIGASFAMLVVSHGVATAVNVGNARVYAFKYGRLNRLTIDDTEAQHLLNVGAIRREEAKDHPSRRTLTNSVGTIDIRQGQRMHMSSPTPVEHGDIFLICSNGLTDYLSDDRISYILSLRMSNQRLTQRLISEAIAKGADDNVTAVIVRSGKSGKPSRVNKSLIKTGIIVILLAVIAAYLSSAPWKKGHSAPTPAVETVAPTQTPSSVLNNTPTPPVVNDDEFELRD